MFKPQSTRAFPFRPRRRYRVVKNFTPLYDEPFHAGAMLVYDGTGHSIYDGMDGYFFREANAFRKRRRWDISTFDDIETWSTLFELQPEPERRLSLPRLLALAALLLALVALSSRSAHADPAYDRCVAQSDSTNQAWSQCGAEWIAREDARLNAIWKRVYPMLEGDAAKALLVEQRAWIAYKDASCGFYATGEYGREGQALHFPMCRAAVIAARVDDLSGMSAFLSQGR